LTQGEHYNPENPGSTCLLLRLERDVVLLRPAEAVRAVLLRAPGRRDALLRQDGDRGADGRGIPRTEPHMTVFSLEGLDDRPADAPGAAWDECLFPTQSQIYRALSSSS
jgi:hypothetical protein